MERLALWARWPMKSSVQSWFSGSRPYCSKYFAHEVIGAELVLRVQAVLLQILCPLGQLRPPRRNELRIAFGLRDGVTKQKHVAAFLHRHSFAAVVTTGDERIRAQIVRRIRELPVGGGGVHQDVNKRRLSQRGAEQNQHRIHWIKHVHGGDVAVARVLFGEVERLDRKSTRPN